MLNCKRINPKWLIIIIITILTMIYYTNRTITNTYCLEQYNIVECPSELYLETYAFVSIHSNKLPILAPFYVIRVVVHLCLVARQLFIPVR